MPTDPCGFASGARTKTPLVAPEHAPKLTRVDDSGERAIAFYPDQLVSSLSAVLLVMCLVVILTIFLPVGLQAKADPNLTPAHVKPEWHFLFLYAFLHFMPAAVGIFAPIVAIFALVALPFLDRNPERAPRKRVLAVGGCVLVSLSIVALSVLGYLQ